MHPPDVDDVLLVRPSARKVASGLVVMLGALGVYVVLGAAGTFSPWLAWFGSVVCACILLVGAVEAVRARRAPWVLRLDTQGVTVPGHPVCPWADLAEVRITGLRPRWLFTVLFRWRVGGKAVSFLGRPGAQLPAPTRRSHRLSIRIYGSPLVVFLNTLDATPQQIVDAVRRFSDVPVRETK